MRVLTILLLSFMVVACGTPRAVDSSEDLKAWQGTWKMISATYDGEPQAGDLLWIVQGDQYRTRYQQHKGIYKVGGDSLALCYDLTDSQYPTSFEAARGSRRVVYQFRRQ